MIKLNCWEFKRCGREPGGEKAEESGICPAAKSVITHRINSGINGGRCCWVISKTLCGGEEQGGFTAKLNGCLRCKFYEIVRKEEGEKYKSSREIMKIVKK